MVYARRTYRHCFGQAILTFDHLTHFGGGTGAQRWTYRSQLISTHRMDAILSTGIGIPGHIELD